MISQCFCFGLLFMVGVAMASPSQEQALSLRESIDLALKNNHDVLQAREALEASRAKLSSARAQFFPKVSLEVDGGAYHDRVPRPGDTSMPVIPRARNSYLVQLNLSQSIFSGFQHSSATERFSADEEISEIDLEIAKEQAIEEIIRLYFGLQLSEREIISEREVQNFRERELKEVEHRMRRGGATDFHKLRAVYEVTKQVPRIQQMETDLSLKRLTFYRRINVPLDSNYKLADILPEKGSFEGPVKLPSLAQALEYALEHNLRVRKIESQFRSLQAESGESLSVHLPRLSIDLNAGTTAYQQQDIGSQDSLNYGAILKLNVPLFSGFDSVSDQKFWHSRLEQLREKKAKFREDLLADFNETYRRLEMSKSRIESSRVNLDLTQRAVRRAQDFYKEGGITLPDVLGAYSASLEARKTAMQEEYEQIIAFFHLKTILGLGADFDASVVSAKIEKGKASPDSPPAESR